MNLITPSPKLTSADLARLRADFPILAEKVHGKPLVFLDSAASAQKPRAVIDAMVHTMEHAYANVHRGLHWMSERATEAYESTRDAVASLINAPDRHEIIFTRNVTESINLVAHSYGSRLGPGDVVVLSEIEHHANLVPWLMLAEQRGVELRYLPLGEDFRLDLGRLEETVHGAKLVAVTAASNVLGTVVDLPPIIEAAHDAGARVLVDGAQLVPHQHVDLAALGADFFGFTGHKMLGPTGIGVLWARHELLEEMPPFLGGGEMIFDVRLDGFTPNDPPWKFEAGTPPIAEAIGLASAVDYLEQIGLERIAAHEASLTGYALAAISERHGDVLRILGPGPEGRVGVISLAFDEIHPHDVAQVLDEHGVCVRAGHHCAKPLMRRLGVPATTRASLYLYNDESDVDALVDALGAVRAIFA